MHFSFLGSSPFVRTGLEEGPGASSSMLPSRADALFLGVLAAYALRQWRVAEWVRRHREVSSAVLLAFLGVALIVYGEGKAMAPAFLVMFTHTWLALGYTWLIVVAVSDGTGWVAALMRPRALGALGTISYAIYLLHNPVLGLMHGLVRGREPALRTGADALVTLAALTITVLRSQHRQGKEFGRSLLSRQREWKPVETSSWPPSCARWIPPREACRSRIDRDQYRITGASLHPQPLTPTPCQSLRLKSQTNSTAKFKETVRLC